MGPLGANIRAIPVKGFSLEAVRAICRYLNLPIWCPVPNGDLVRCSWIVFFCGFATRFGCVPTVISPQKSARWHAQRLARCVTSVRTVVTVKSIQCTVCLCLPMPMLCLPSCSRCAGILKEKQHLVYARLLFEWFPSFDLHTTGD